MSLDRSLLNTLDGFFKKKAEGIWPEPGPIHLHPRWGLPAPGSPPAMPLGHRPLESSSPVLPFDPAALGGPPVSGIYLTAPASPEMGYTPSTPFDLTGGGPFPGLHTDGIRPAPSRHILSPPATGADPAPTSRMPTRPLGRDVDRPTVPEPAGPTPGLHSVPPARPLSEYRNYGPTNFETPPELSDVRTPSPTEIRNAMPGPLTWRLADVGRDAATAAIRAQTASRLPGALGYLMNRGSDALQNVPSALGNIVTDPVGSLATGVNLLTAPGPRRPPPDPSLWDRFQSLPGYVKYPAMGLGVGLPLWALYNLFNSSDDDEED